MELVEINEQKLVEFVVEELDYSALADAISKDSEELIKEITNAIGVEEVANTIGAESVAEHIDLRKLSQHLPQTELQNHVEKLTRDVEDLKVNLLLQQEALKMNREALESLMPLVELFKKIKLMIKQ